MGKTEQFRLLLVEDNPGDADLAAERLSEMPDRTHTFKVRHPRRLTAASRRAPHTRTPSGVIVTGWSTPSFLMEATSGSMSSLGFLRWRTPTTIESTLRSSSM